MAGYLCLSLWDKCVANVACLRDKCVACPYEAWLFNPLHHVLWFVLDACTVENTGDFFLKRNFAVVLLLALNIFFLRQVAMTYYR